MKDRATVWVDVREPSVFEDHNTRIIVFGKDGKQASEVAAALAREAFHNVTYFAGTYEELNSSLEE